MSERGEYRSIHTVLADGPDFRALSPAAKLCFYTLKLKLGAAGIDVFYLETLPRLTGLSADETAAACAEMEHAGWLATEDNIAWIVDGLAHEPSISPDNSKHRTGLTSHLADLPHLGIVDRFRQHYPEWFPVATETYDDTHTIGIQEASDTHGHTLKTEDGRLNTENPPPSPPAQTTSRQAFLDALPDAKARKRWEAQIAGWREGLGLAQVATEDDIEIGLGDYLLAGHRDFSPKHVRGFIRNAIHARLNPPKTTGPPTTNGASRSRKLTTAERVFIRASGGHA